MRRFQPGESGNPAGRPIGARNRTARALDGLLSESERKSIVQSLIDKAKKGDTAAASVLLDRIWPKLRTVAPSIHVALPDGDIVAKAEAIVAAIATGELPADLGADILSALAAITRLREFTEFADRLTALEKRLLNKGIPDET